MDLSPRSRRAIATVLALVLAAETVSAVAVAAAPRIVTHSLPVQPPAGVVLAAELVLGTVMVIVLLSSIGQLRSNAAVAESIRDCRAVIWRLYPSRSLVQTDSAWA